MATLVASNGMVVSEETALKWAVLDGKEFNAAVGHLARKGYGAVEYRRRVSAYSELRRALRETTASAVTVVETSRGPKVQAKGRGFTCKGGAATGGTRRDGSPKSHCFACFVNERIALRAVS